jgi:hypothetical protein
MPFTSTLVLMAVMVERRIFKSLKINPKGIPLFLGNHSLGFPDFWKNLGKELLVDYMFCQR